jgi:hypothetical protein
MQIATARRDDCKICNGSAALYTIYTHTPFRVLTAAGRNLGPQLLSGINSFNTIFFCQHVRRSFWDCKESAGHSYTSGFFFIQDELYRGNGYGELGLFFCPQIHDGMMAFSYTQLGVGG